MFHFIINPLYRIPRYSRTGRRIGTILHVIQSIGLFYTNCFFARYFFGGVVDSGLKCGFPLLSHTLLHRLGSRNILYLCRNGLRRIPQVDGKVAGYAATARTHRPECCHSTIWRIHSDAHTQQKLFLLDSEFRGPPKKSATDPSTLSILAAHGARRLLAN